MADKLRIVQVGLGGWGWSWLDIVANSPDCELAAAVDVDAARLQQARTAYKLDKSQVHSSLAAAVGACRPDACLVVVPPEVHAPVTIEAARFGLHCLVEKPIAGTMAEAKAMVDAAAAAGVRLMINQNYRFRRAARTVRRLVRSGVVGRLGSIDVRFQKTARFGGGFREQMDHPLVLDMAIHHFDQLRGLVGFEPVEVSARSWNPSWSWFRGDACANVVFTAADGAVAVYAGSWVSRGWETTWDGDWRIQGEAGELHWADNAVTLRPESVFTSVFHPGAREAAGRLSFDLDTLPREDRSATLSEFSRSVASGEEPETSGVDNLRTLATVLAVRESITRKEPVRIDEILAS
jgi:predicted dehydrogenase